MDGSATAPLVATPTPEPMQSASAASPNTSASTTAATAPKPRPPKGASTKPAGASGKGCDPPYYFDEKKRKRYKPECL